MNNNNYDVSVNKNLLKHPNLLLKMMKNTIRQVQNKVQLANIIHRVQNEVQLAKTIRRRVQNKARSKK